MTRGAFSGCHGGQKGSSRRRAQRLAAPALLLGLVLALLIGSARADESAMSGERDPSYWEHPNTKINIAEGVESDKLCPWMM
jgi:hypothetical protein